MPKVKGLTQKQKNHRNNDLQCKKIRDIFNSYLDTSPVSFLAALMHMKPIDLQRRFKGDTKWDVQTFTKVCNTLGVSNDDILRMMGRTP